MTGNIAEYFTEEALSRQSKHPISPDSTITPSENNQQIELADIINAPAIQAMMNDFFSLTHIGVGIIDLHGKVLVATGWQDICVLFHRVHPQTLEHCLESDSLLASGVEPGTFKMYKCKNHLWDIATPIMIDQKHVGNLFLGQFFFDDELPDYDLFRAQAQQYGFDETAYLAAMERAPRWSREKVITAMRFYARFAQQISTLIEDTLTLNHTLAERDILFESLQKSREKYRTMIEYSSDPIFSFNPDETYRFVNETFAKIFGKTPEEIIGKTPHSIFPHDEAEKRLALVRRVFSTGEKDEIEVKVVTHTGVERFYLTLADPIKDNEGKTIWVSCISKDITERKYIETEKVKFESQNRQLQKAESLSRMAGAIAHQFNNLLTGVMGNLELAMMDLPSQWGPFKHLTQAMMAAHKAAEVSKMMLTYLGQSPLNLEPLSLSETCARNIAVLRVAMPKNVVLQTDLPSPGPLINGNVNQMVQLFTNLVTNAWEAIGEAEGVVSLAVKTVSVTDIPTAYCFPPDRSIYDQTYACLQVTDTGCGIAEKDIEMLFDPFFSSKFIGRGLGLPVVLGIVRMHTGFITVESELNRGSTFRVFFPLVTPEVLSPAKPMIPAPPQNLHNTILLVEDEQMVRNLARDILVRLKFTVLIAKDGVEAVELFQQHQTEISCVLCDLTMPRMDGWATLTVLRQLAPNLPFILASGYDEAHVMAGNHPEQPQVFLNKPYRIQEIRQAINLALGDHSA